MKPISANARWFALTGTACLALVLILATGCERVAPVRTLPSWVRGIYIPTFKNKSFEPQIEENATRLTQEAFLADGRVDIVPKSEADLTLVVEIQDWQSMTTNTTGEHVATDDDVTLIASAKLFEPFDNKEPLADLGTIKVTTRFNVDTRSIEYIPEPDRKDQLLRALAQQILYKTITGFPTNLRDLPPGVTVPQYRSPESIEGGDVLKPRKSEDSSQP